MVSAQIVVPWMNGKLLVWDTTFSDTSYRAGNAGDVASQAEERKLQKYLRLGQNSVFIPIAIKTTGVINPKGQRLKQQIGEEKSLTYLLQRLSMAVQRAMLSP